MERFILQFVGFMLKYTRQFLMEGFEYDRKQKKIQNNHSRKDLYDCGK